MKPKKKPKPKKVDRFLPVDPAMDGTLEKPVYRSDTGVFGSVTGCYRKKRLRGAD